MSLFITFEGTEGSGKTTQIHLLAQALRSHGLEVVTTREPGGTTFGEALRGIVLETDTPIAPLTEALLMSAARVEHVRNVIRPALQRGAVVLCDRFYDSTYAYQGAGRGLSVPDLQSLQECVVDGCHPHLTILLDLPVEVGLRRRMQEGGDNRIDAESIEFHERVAAWYRAAAASDTGRWIVIDATLPPDLVHTAIRDLVMSRVGVVADIQHGS